MSIQYRGDDGRIHSLGDGNSLQHWKYIKKIPVGNGFRYFYSQEELRAYYNEMKGKAEGKLDEAQRQSKDKWRYAKPQSPEEMRRRANADMRKEQSRHNSTYEKLDSKRWKMMRDPNRPDNLARDKQFQKNEKRIVDENRRHEYENRKNSSRKAAADRYARAVDTAKEKWEYGRPQKPSTMRQKVARDSAKESNRYSKERERIHKNDLRVFDDQKNSKNMSAKDYRNLRNRIKKNNDDWYKNRDTHEEQTRKNSDRRYNADRYQNAVDAPKKAVEKANRKRKKVSKAASNTLKKARSEGAHKINKGRSSVEKRLNKARKKKLTKGNDLDGFKIMDRYGRSSIEKKDTRRKSNKQKSQDMDGFKIIDRYGRGSIRKKKSRR